MEPPRPIWLPQAPNLPSLVNPPSTQTLLRTRWRWTGAPQPMLCKKTRQLWSVTCMPDWRCSRFCALCFVCVNVFFHDSLVPMVLFCILVSFLINILSINMRVCVLFMCVCIFSMHIIYFILFLGMELCVVDFCDELFFQWEDNNNNKQGCVKGDLFCIFAKKASFIKSSEYYFESCVNCLGWMVLGRRWTIPKI